MLQPWTKLTFKITTTNFTSYKSWSRRLIHQIVTFSPGGAELELLAKSLKPGLGPETPALLNTSRSSMQKLKVGITELLKWTTKPMKRNKKRLRRRNPRLSNKTSQVPWTKKFRTWWDWSSIWRWWTIKWRKSVMTLQRCLWVNWPNQVSWKVMRPWKSWWSKWREKKEKMW